MVKWINIVCQAHTMPYYPARKRNKLWIHTAVWMNPKGTMPNVRTQFQNLHIIGFCIYNILEKEFHVENRSVVARDKA